MFSQAKSITDKSGNRVIALNDSYDNFQPLHNSCTTNHLVPCNGAFYLGIFSTPYLNCFICWRAGNPVTIHWKLNRGDGFSVTCDNSQLLVINLIFDSQLLTNWQAMKLQSLIYLSNPPDFNTEKTSSGWAFFNFFAIVEFEGFQVRLRISIFVCS